MFCFLKRLTNSPWGRALRAVREDEDAVRALGKNAVWLKLQSFMLGAGIAGLADTAFNYGSSNNNICSLLTFMFGNYDTWRSWKFDGPISIIFWSLSQKQG